MNGWQRYRNYVMGNTIGPIEPNLKDLSFWRDYLFANVLLYSIPVSLVALVPCLVAAYINGQDVLACIELFAFCTMLLITFTRRLRLQVKKTFLVVLLYLLAVSLTVFLGTFGPGVLYLWAVTIFTALTFSPKKAYLTVAVNCVLCLGFGVVIQYRLFDLPLLELYSTSGWIVFSVNLLFLSLITSALLDLVFTGLQKTIVREANLKRRLKEKGKHLGQMLITVKSQNEELERFAYIASHDLQEPLRTISSLVDHLESQNQGRLDEPSQMYLRFLRQSVHRMRALITGLLEYSRIGKENALEWVNCQTLLETVLADLDTFIKEKEAEIQADNLPQLQGYALEIKQLFQNLISNALKFQRPGTQPCLQIKVQKLDKHWLFSFIDNGIGIEPKFQDKVFAIFQRLHPKSRYEGTGIGLAYCRKIVELHGGKIWVEPNPEGGSIFRFSLPLTKEQCLPEA
ncbi:MULTISPECIES: sensor histidine kinase [Rufibacter]|uniref:histidine kinase n=1 Tax=Rufibacter quisquiliarum TaxID=1549639 RepID=A0A839GVA6_9BACT|nr:MULTISPECIES: ATP-binding protein [Rufibacter]MBA9078797.1 signal transduction histidine kinase [Rufibacter quisquiliarum]